MEVAYEEQHELDYEEQHEAEFDALTVRIRGREEDGARLGEKHPGRLHARRVVAELGVDEGVIYLAGQPTVNLEDSDQARPFRQRRYFFYIAGANFADCHVTYEIGAQRLILWIPYMEARQVLWYGRQPDAGQCLQMTDVDEVRYASQLGGFMGRLAGSTTVYLLHGEQQPPGPLGRLVLEATKLQPAMDRARVVKTDYEVAMVRRANAVSSMAHRRVAEQLLGLASERDVEAVFQAACTQGGSREQAYAIIAAAGANAATLHYGANADSLRGRQLLVLDAGCEVNCYASDVTRTLPVSGRYSPPARAMHALVQRMQDECIQRVAAGVVFYHLHVHACAVALDGLLDLGILHGPRADIERAGTVAAFFPHGLGHHVGLEVHDVPGQRPLIASHGLRLEDGKRAMVTPAALVAMQRDAWQPSATSAEHQRQRLRPNMVVTIEPGIYFCRQYLEGYFLRHPVHSRFIDAAKLATYYPVGGVRIEDDVLVKERGYEVLTTAPKGRELLDIINHGR
ncbi:hypothetical protein CDD82_4871 [Ophiocordyceps australis]|uniref:Xaa-Pro aminopeptidase n=1 Tax=Ophiocordyceps australis TaxID=1399860 RepID=A0A2C5XJE9_9HYPO|nr:hypothetical protein CDD82_4871 [Ophiocordyceps australis]